MKGFLSMEVVTVSSATPGLVLGVLGMDFFFSLEHVSFHLEGHWVVVAWLGLYPTRGRIIMRSLMVKNSRQRFLGMDIPGKATVLLA